MVLCTPCLAIRTAYSQRKYSCTVRYAYLFIFCSFFDFIVLFKENKGNINIIITYTFDVTI